LYTRTLTQLGHKHRFCYHSFHLQLNFDAVWRESLKMHRSIAAAIRIHYVAVHPITKRAPISSLCVSTQAAEIALSIWMCGRSSQRSTGRRASSYEFCCAQCWRRTSQWLHIL